MKRSAINAAVKEMENFAAKLGFKLPPFCGFTPAEWAGKGREFDEIRDLALGWDIPDFGLGRFDEVGLSLVTLRNGRIGSEKYPKPYAEKLMYLKEGQQCPTHFHWLKTEDIINRGGGNVLITVFNADADEGLADTDVTVSRDGVSVTVAAGSEIRLRPGESLTITPYLYHNFTVEAGSGGVLLGEVSMRNDDGGDNRFYEPVGRFPAIDEDEPPYRLLCGEYPKELKL